MSFRFFEKFSNNIIFFYPGDDMAAFHLFFQNLTFYYESSLNPLFENLNLTFSKGYTGIVGKNGSGKTTLLKLATGLLEPIDGNVTTSKKVIYCSQITDFHPVKFKDFLECQDGFSNKLKGILKITNDWLFNWNHLSHGQRKRCQIATALWQEPEILALDEPTNHLDHQTKELLLRALKEFKGVGLIVSHDRDLLDDLTHQCLFIDQGEAVMRPGNYSKGLEDDKQENQAKKNQYENVKKEYQKLNREKKRRKHIASQQDKKNSKKNLAKKDHDAKAKIDLARLTGKDGVAGKLLKQMQSRVDQLKDKLDSIQYKREGRLGIWIEGSFSRKNLLFDLKSKTIQYDSYQCLYPDLSMLPQDRVALTGPNGTGKSVLINEILTHLNISEEKLLYIPQEISQEETKHIKNRLQKLSNTDLGKIMIIISHLGSDPKSVLSSENYSPGEVRKILIALGILKEPHLIILDEPTNHLDIYAIECLENALKECPCGLLLVSHDQRFLKTLTRIHWSIYHSDQKNSFELVIN